MRKDIYLHIGGRIRQERQRAGMTMQRLAQLADISPSFLAYIETHGRKASLETVDSLAAALRIPVAELFRDAPQEKEDAVVLMAATKFRALVRGLNDRQLSAVLESVKVISAAFSSGGAR